MELLFMSWFGWACAWGVLAQSRLRAEFYFPLLFWGGMLMTCFEVVCML